VKPGQQFLYFDPLASLDPEVRRRWLTEGEPQQIVNDALRAAALDVRDPGAALWLAPLVPRFN
jgi:hypothetical protein